MNNKSNGELRCPTCGCLFRKISELTNVHSAGLALFGECPRCGCKIPCETLFVVTSREVKSANFVKFDLHKVL
jgi:predicted protein tyrosine phosphatase